jgi:uncharacterized protein DUF1360
VLPQSEGRSLSVPDWWEAALLALGAWRIFQLLAHDTILDWPRRRALRLSKDWQEGQQPNAEYRLNWALFLTCPYCAGFWIALVWWGAWQIWPHGTLVAAGALAINAGVIALAKTIGSE